MTSIHEPKLSSLRPDPSGERERAQTQFAALARRNDELELVIAASHLGFCVLDSETSGLRANSQFKAEFGWAPDAQLDWQGLLERVGAESRLTLADAARTALASRADFDLAVQAVWPDGTTQWIALQGRATNDANNHRTVILT